MTAQETRLQLAALEEMAHRLRARMDWTLEPRDHAHLDPAIFPPGVEYCQVNITIRGGNFCSGFGGIFSEAQLHLVALQTRDIIESYSQERATLEDTPEQPTLDLFDEMDEPPDPWALDTSPELQGLTCIEINEAYIPYLINGGDTGDMTEEEIKLCDEFSRSWRAIDTATRNNGEPYTSEFNSRPGLCLHGYACRTEGVWCQPILEPITEPA